MISRKEYHKVYYAAHKEELKTYHAKYREMNREAMRGYGAKYREENKEVVNISQAKYREKNREAINRRGKEFYEKNKEKIIRKTCARNLVRLKCDLNYRMCHSLRQRIRQALRGINKSARTLELLGCTIDFLWAHLEKQFVPGMTRENYGPVWHVDHILPCAKFHLQHSEEQEICFHWTNLQPLFAADNLSKSDKIN